MPATIVRVWEWVRPILKSGKPSARVLMVPAGMACPVCCCEWCGRYGSPVWIRGWYMRNYLAFDLRRKDNAYVPEPKICIGCMNRARRDWRTQHILMENRRLINAIKREITRVNSENRRRSAQLPG